jgi:hypothetical protein
MRKLSIFFLFALLVSGTCFAQQAQLLSIKYGKKIDRQVKVEFLLTDKAEYKAFFLTKPNRLVIDFTGASLVKGFLAPIGKPLYIERMRSSQRDKNILRIVFDFKIGIKPDMFIIKKDRLNEKHILLNLALSQEIGNVKQDVQEASIAVPATIDAGNAEVIPEAAKSGMDFSDWEISGKLSVEELGFFHHKLDSQQHNNYISGAIEPEIYREWDNGKQRFTFSPFFRYSQHDSRRTHFDIRELTWLLSEGDWELHVGFRKVFWGVAEGLHLVDIINQTDLIENTDTEDKLGQPMINLALIRDWGTIDLFVLPGFRERTFSGAEGRFRSFPEVSVGEAEYEHSGIKKHMAYAIRWSHVIGDWDVGFSHFHGTSRDPSFKTKFSSSGSFQLIPYYELINQTGLDLQLTYEDWILKHEGIVREGQGSTFYAMTAGIEYTLFDLFSSGLDLGFVVEYMYDTRGSGSMLAPFQDDFLTALRFGFNDVQSTEILAGIMFDRTNNSKFYNIEASRRIGDSFKVDLEVRLFSGASSTDPSYSIRDDDHIRLEFGYYF